MRPAQRDSTPESEGAHMDIKFTGQLFAADWSAPSFSGCRVEIYFSRKPPSDASPADTAEPGLSESRMVDTTADGGTEDTKPPRVERIPVLPDSDGKFSGVITQVETIAGDILKVVVSASVGGPLRTLEVVLDRTATSLHFSIDGIVVPDLDLSELKVSGKPPTRRVTGLVIDLQGKPIPAGRQVTLIASQSARQPAEKGTA